MNLWTWGAVRKGIHPGQTALGLDLAPGVHTCGLEDEKITVSAKLWRQP